MEATFLQTAFGRIPLRFSLEIVPKTVEELPSDVTSVSVVWEKGNKVTFTDATSVDPTDGTATFAQVMRQTTTVYKQGNTLLSKPFTFKVQSVKSAGAASTSSSISSMFSQLRDSSSTSSRRRTIARAKVDLAPYCSPSTTSSAATEVRVPLQPRGMLVLSIRTVWLQHYDRAKTNHMMQQGPDRSFGQHWGSTSDTSTEVSSATGSPYGSCLSDNDRDEMHTGSAELDRLLQEAEAATVAKTSVPGAGCKGATTVVLAALKPNIMSLATLSTTNKLSKLPAKAHRTGSMPGTVQQLPTSPWGTRLLGPPGARHSGTAATSSTCSGRAVEAAPASNTSSSTGCGRRSHRRASSVPETPTIAEDLEGLDASNSVEMPCPRLKGCTRAADKPQQSLPEPAMPREQHPAPTPEEPPSQPQAPGSARPLPFGLKLSTGACNADYDDDEKASADEPAWMDTCASGTASALQKPGPEGLRSLSGRMPAWLWPSSRLAVSGMTTDEIMQRINTNRDVTALQGMCRGLLCERNDWRYRATQAERANEGLQQQLQQLRESEASAREQLQRQQPEAQLLQRLVEAKLELAQADLTMQDLKGQLERERKRHMQSLARLTSLQGDFDRYINEQQSAKCGACLSCGCGVSEGRVHGLGMVIGSLTRQARSL